MTLDLTMMCFGYIVFSLLSIVVLLVIFILTVYKMETWLIFNPKQKFALLPKSVWNMKSKNYCQTLIWFCWYWDSGEHYSKTKYYRLTDDEEQPMQWHRFIRTSTNSW